MSIVRMNKISVIGLDSVKENLISGLMSLGAVEINSQESKISDEKWNGLVERDRSKADLSAMENELANIRQVLETLEKYDKEKGPLITVRKEVSNAQFLEASANREEVGETVFRVLSLTQRLESIMAEINGKTMELTSLIPWKGYGIPLEISETAETRLLTGTLPVSIKEQELFKSLEEVCEESAGEILFRDKEFAYLSLIHKKGKEEEVRQILKQEGFTLISLFGKNGTAAENSVRLREEMEALQRAKEEVMGEISGCAKERGAIGYLYDSLTIEHDREKIHERILNTKQAFYLDGWLPVACREKTEQLLLQNGCYYEIEEPSEEEKDQVPVMLLNSNMVTPFEAVTQLYSLPMPGNIDPTKFFAPFYVLFFGMMLSDAGYGILLSLGCAILLKKFDLEGMFYKMVKMFFYCGLSTVFWGAMFGGWFGDFFTVAAKTIFDVDFVIRPIWFNPLDDPMKLLIFSLGLGVVHLFFAMGINAYLMIREGRIFDAFCDVGLWYFLVGGAGLLLLGGATKTIGMGMLIFGAVGILLTGGRKKKGIGKVTGGLGALYGVTNYLSDILSYSRLLALGIATGVIAQVVNTMGSLAGGGILGIVLLLVVFVVGHTFNLAINMLGSFVHASRLQYVEFFGKFFEGGGEPFTPFCKETKYVKIRKEN